VYGVGAPGLGLVIGLVLRAGALRHAEGGVGVYDVAAIRLVVLMLGRRYSSRHNDTRTQSRTDRSR